MDPSVIDPFVGTWTYRSFRSLPDPDLEFNTIRFGQCDLIIERFAPSRFTGRLVFRSGDEMRLTGSSSFGKR